MQKIILFIFLNLITNQVNSQILPNVYSQMFDSTKAMVVSSYMSSSGNDGDAYGDGISYFLESLLLMYELTNDKKYLDDFIEVSHELISNRDDYRNVNQQKPYWSSSHRDCYGPITYQTALIIAPIAHYIYLSKKVETVSFNSSLIAPLTTFDNEILTSYNQYGDWLIEKINTTWNYYDQHYWIPNRGYRQYADDPCYNTSDDVDGMDRNCNWGVVNTYLALAFEGDQLGDVFFDRAQTAAYQLKMQMNDVLSANGANCYQWRYEGWKNTNDYHSDDISHAGAVVDFANLCNKFKGLMKSTVQGGCCPNGYFLDSDMNKIANTLIHIVYQNPLTYHNVIDGTCYFYKWPNCEKGDFVMPYGTVRWQQLATAKDAAKYPNTTNLTYPIVSDFISTFNESPYLTFSHTVENSDGTYKRYGGSRGATILGIAHAAANQGLFKFLGRNSNPGGSHDNDWQGAASGDFDNDGKSNEVVSVRNSDGGFYFYRVESNNKAYSESGLTVNYTDIGYQLSTTGSVITGGVKTGGANSLWKGITVGHFVSDIPGDQIAAIRESDGTIFVWRPIYNSLLGSYTLQTILTNNSSGTGNDWVGITSGDFDNDGVLEISAIRNYDGGIYVWKVIKTGANYHLNTLLVNNTSGVGNQWGGLSAGDINNDGKSELVAVRNSDGGIFIWKIINTNNIYTLSTLVFDNTSGSGNQWNGLTIGDFNSDGTKDIVVHRDVDGAFFIYNVNGTSLVNKGIEYFPVSQDLRVFSKCNLPNFSKKDVFVNFRNSDGDIVLYEVSIPKKPGKEDPSDSPLKNVRQDENSKSRNISPINFIVSPNPCVNEISVYSNVMSGRVKLEIYDINGVLLLQNLNYQINDKFDISYLNKSIYFLKIIDANNTVSTFKLIKN